MAVLVCLAGFVVLVGLLTAKNAHRTDGRACCSPADPERDLRMRAADDEHVGRDVGPTANQ
jgi:hypothetical protein